MILETHQRNNQLKIDSFPVLKLIVESEVSKMEKNLIHASHDQSWQEWGNTPDGPGSWGRTSTNCPLLKSENNKPLSYLTVD